MRNDPDDDADPDARAMSQLTLVDGTRIHGHLFKGKFLEVFENEQASENDEGPPPLQIVAVPDVMHANGSGLILNVPGAGPRVEGNAGAGGLSRTALKFTLSFQRNLANSVNDLLTR